MSSREDYYVILGVVRTCSDEELKKAFRKAALQHHPDRNPGDTAAMERFKQINEAYQVLSDPQKRAAYDQFGHAGVNQGQGFGGFDGGNPFGGSFSDIFDNIFGDIFGQGGRSSSGGMDLRYNLEIDFEEAAFGTEKQINFEKESACETCQGLGAKSGTRPKTCRTCRGTGQVSFNQGVFVLSRKCSTCQGRGAVIEEKCTACRGKGSIRKPHTLSVKIPAGIDTDQRLRLRNEGEITEAGGRPGDLYVHVLVKEHTLFKREGEHVILEMPITIVQAALGAELEIPTLGGTTKLKILPGTQTGATLRLRGKGICRLNGTGFGDQIILLTVETPSSLTSKQKELLREFEAEGNAQSQPGIMNFVQRFKEIFKT